jgi:hypothetical protein
MFGAELAAVEARHSHARAGVGFGSVDRYGPVTGTANPVDSPPMCSSALESVVLIGLQASGKTTFRQAKFDATHVIVSKDLFRNNSKPQRRQMQLTNQSAETPSARESYEFRTLVSLQRLKHCGRHRMRKDSMRCTWSR